MLKHKVQQNDVELTVLGSCGFVEVNGECLKKKDAVSIRGGDELAFSCQRHHTYIFQLLVNEDISTPVLPTSVAKTGNQVVAGKAEEKITGGAELTEALAAILGPLQGPMSGSLPSLSLLPHRHPSCNNSEEFYQGSIASQSQTACNMSNEFASDTKEIVLEAALDSGVPPMLSVLRCRRKPYKKGYMHNEIYGKSPIQVCEGRRESIRAIDPSVAHAKCQTLKEDLRQGIIDGRETHVSFDNFPYYLSKKTKSLLIASTFIHLKRNEFTKFTKELPNVSPRILMSGRQGSEIYQEMLVKALANHFDAKLLIFDSNSMLTGSISISISATFYDLNLVMVSKLSFHTVI